MIQMPSTVVVPGRSRMIVGREIRTMYLYCIREPEAPPRPSGIYLVESRAAIRRDAANAVGEVPCDPVPRKGYRPAFRFATGERMAALPAFLKLKVDHKTVLCRDVNTYRALRDFLLNSGYSSVYETERVGEEKTAMATFACLSPLTGERLAVVLGMSAPNE